ncbi:hypothetical protein [Macrococcus carouselicus]|nr:hypothetical protein [Macrococcus carouselicus]
MAEEKDMNAEEVKEQRTEKRFEQDAAAEREEQQNTENEKKNFI